MVEESALFLINNGSIDGTRDFCIAMANLPNVYFLDLPDNVGVANSWNCGLDMAFTELNCKTCLILNNDILLKKQTIPMIIEDLKNPNVALISANNIMGKCVNEDEFFSLPEAEGYSYEETPDFSCFGINKKCFEKVGYFDGDIYPAYFEDNDYHYRINLKGLKAYKNLCNVYWHYGSRTLKTDPDVAEWLRYCYVLNKKYYFDKWGGEPGNETYTIAFNGKDYARDDIIDLKTYKEKVKGLNS
jgi:GT2 family glycosyltransferase